MKAAGSAVEVVEAQRLDRARRAERNPPQGRERQIELSRGRRRCVPVAETNQPVAVHHGVVRRRILMTHNQAGLQRAADEPPFVRRRDEAHGRVMEATQPSADLDQRRVTPHPGWPRFPVADRFAGQVGEHLAALIVKTQRPRSIVEADILQVSQQGVHRGRPGCGWLVDDVTDQHGARGQTARQALIGHARFVQHLDHARATGRGVSSADRNPRTENTVTDEIASHADVHLRSGDQGVQVSADSARRGRRRLCAADGPGRAWRGRTATEAPSRHDGHQCEDQSESHHNL